MRLFVGGMDFRTKADDMMLHFNVDAGSEDALSGCSVRVVEAQVIMDQDTGRSKGFGFVELETDLTLTQVVGFFSGFKLMGKKLTLGEAHAKKPKAEMRQQARDNDVDGNRGRYVTERSRR